MIRFLLLNIRKPIAVLLLWLFLIAPLMGQSLLVESAATTVVIKRDNLVKAKADALKDAKGQSVMQAVERLLDYNSIDSLKPLLQKIFFEKPDNFIESIRVISEGSTHDLSEFIISIEARIFKSQLLAAFRKLGVPTKNERISFRDYFLIYNADQELRESEVKLHIIADENNSQNYNLNTDLIFWSPQTDLKESSNSSIRASTMMSYTAGQIEAIIPSILDKLLLNWTPLIQKALTIYAGTGLEVKLKFKGISGPIQEQQLIKTLFQNNPRWKNLRLDVISENYVSYGALFIGKKDDIFQEFIPPPDAPFKISYLNWDENMLFVNVEWNERPASLEPFFELVQESDFFESESEEINLPVPELQVPLSPFKQTYSLPLASTVYDNIRHRGDSTLFMIKTYEEDGSKDESKSIKITWNRLGPTQLRPKLTLYDQNRKRLKTYLLKRKKQFSFKYKLPADRNAIYLRISDEIGFLNGVAGSYQSFRYILIAN